MTNSADLRKDRIKINPDRQAESVESQEVDPGRNTELYLHLAKAAVYAKFNPLHGMCEVSLDQTKYNDILNQAGWSSTSTIQKTTWTQSGFSADELRLETSRVKSRDESKLLMSPATILALQSCQALFERDSGYHDYTHEAGLHFRNRYGILPIDHPDIAGVRTYRIRKMPNPSYEFGMVPREYSQNDPGEPVPVLEFLQLAMRNAQAQLDKLLEHPNEDMIALITREQILRITSPAELKLQHGWLQDYIVDCEETRILSHSDSELYHAWKRAKHRSLVLKLNEIFTGVFIPANVLIYLTLSEKFLPATISVSIALLITQTLLYTKGTPEDVERLIEERVNKLRRQMR